ncbi:GLO2 [Hepatospora eriocheir]|uniref:GLO2 n=1 Tax=Hepatospora eriocheir TaxID=1081669 RepID=A0A1X0QKT8_9MICR|nr:GLO2 [Hepatospora eriocheir]
MEFCAIVANSDNYMYLFYTDEIAIVFDPCDYLAVYKALSFKLENGKVYQRNFFNKLECNTKKRTLIKCFITHHHYDHSGGNEPLKKLSPETVFINHNNSIDNLSKIIIEYNNQHLLTVLAIKTPCHTLDSISYYLTNLNGEKFLVTGDFIFKVGCGKFFEGKAVDFISSVNLLKKHVDDDTIMLYGHEYTKSNFEFAKTQCNYNETDTKLILEKTFLTFKDELRLNPFLLSKTLSDPVILQNLRDQKNNFK